MTLDDNNITACGPVIPEPASIGLVLLGSAFILFKRKRTSASSTHQRVTGPGGAALLAAVVVCATFGVPSTAVAATIFTYGDFNANTLDFESVRESSGTDAGPLYGTPTIAGDSLVWNPVSYSATSSGGGSPDVTDGTLAFTIRSHPGEVISQIRFDEAGDFTVVGTGTSTTRAIVAARVFITISEVNGVGINPITFNKAFFHVPSGGVFALTDFPPPGAITEEWHGSTSWISLNQILAEHGITGSATMLQVSLNNTLVAISEMDTTSFIEILSKAVDEV